jgi:hypothetical protein
MSKFLAKFLLASIKTLTISKSGSESLIKFLFRIFFIGLFGRFFQVNMSQAACGIIFRITGSFRNSFNPSITNAKVFF